MAHRWDRSQASQSIVSSFGLSSELAAEIRWDCDTLSFKSVKYLFLSAFKTLFPSSQGLKILSLNRDGTLAH